MATAAPVGASLPMCGACMVARMQVPITYIWSPHLVPRPSDWGPHCEVVGFVNVELQKLMAYTPPRELSDFLAAGARWLELLGGRWGGSRVPCITGKEEVRGSRARALCAIRPLCRRLSLPLGVSAHHSLLHHARCKLVTLVANPPCLGTHLVHHALCKLVTLLSNPPNPQTLKCKPEPRPSWSQTPTKTPTRN